MAKGILYVETRPASPEEAEAYHQWYDETHLQEICAIDGFVSARRFTPVDDDGPFVAIYELEGDDLLAVQQRMTDTLRTGTMSKPVGLSLDPPPVVRLLEVRTAYSS